MEVVNRHLSIKKCRLSFCLFVYVMGIVTQVVSTGGAHKKNPSGQERNKNRPTAANH